MKQIKHSIIYILIILVAWLPMLIAAFDKTKPAATTTLRNSNPEILANWVALETAIDQDHDFTTGGTQTGKHEEITLAVQSSPSGPSASEGTLYTKDVSAKAELHFQDEDSNEIQITSGGILNSLNLTGNQNITGTKTFATLVGTATTVGSLTATGNLDIGAYEMRAQTFESDVATGTAPLTIASTTVVDNLNVDQVDGYDISAYSGGQSYTFPGGLIIKMGSDTCATTGNYSITYDSAFPSGVVSVNLTAVINTDGNPFVWQIRTANTTGFTYRVNSNNSGAGIYWLAIGY